jgi:hypothetical protein
MFLPFTIRMTLITVVFNIKSQEARIVHLTPNDTWGGAGLLGVTIRLDNYAGAEDRFIRVLSVVENGPAAVAGLLNDGTDFILGTTHHTINSLSHFAQLLQGNIDRVIELYVYNSNTDVVRVVTLMPSYEWNAKSGGTGLLGAEVGTGYLHRLPHKSRSTSGKCVERKVRYVPAPTEANHNVVLLEDAPQMEMEPPDPEEDDDENVEEVYNEPKRETNHVSKATEQVSGSETAEVNSTIPSLIEQAVSAISINESEKTATTSALAETALQPKDPSPIPPTRSNTTAASAIFGQPLVPPPPIRQAPPSNAVHTAQSSIGPPPHMATYHGTSSFVPPAMSYSAPPPQSHYYGGQQSHVTTTVPMIPPPPVGGVWNHSTSSNQ